MRPRAEPHMAWQDKLAPLHNRPETCMLAYMQHMHSDSRLGAQGETFMNVSSRCPGGNDGTNLSALCTVLLITLW